MHMGSSSRVLLKRIETEGFRLASNYNHFSELNAIEKKQVLDSFVPGSPFASKENKVTTLLSAFDFISKKGITSTFSPELKKVELLKNLRNIPGIGSKQSRNIAMDLYHPSFRNNTIPIDENWKKISKFLEYKWSDSDKHENEIIEWRNTYICRDKISEDWEFDRLIYIALNDSTSEVYNIVKQK